MPSTDSSKPNVIFILTDDQGYWSLGAYGNREAKTPSLDSLAANGMRFDNFFCVSPVCSPARASLLTGRIPSRHGIHDFLNGGDVKDLSVEPNGKGVAIEYLEGQPGYTDFLNDAGYTCGISGKWHLGDSHNPQKGFKYWEVHAKGGGHYYNAPMMKNGKVYYEKSYITNVITDNALLFLEQQKHEKNPFYLSVHYTAPHSPWDKEEHPAEYYNYFYDNCDFESVPDGILPAEWIESLSIPVKEKEERRKYLSGYFAAVAAMDANVGRILEWLDKNSLTQSTLICFSSDNGMNMGHHGIYGKGNATFPLNMYEESVKVPFIMSLPGRIPQGAVSNDLLSHYDFMPTLLEYLGIDMPDDDKLPGKSFVPLLNGEKIDNKKAVVVFDEYGPVRMIRNEKFKYVHRYPYGPFEFYNLKDDPNETVNLYDNPDFKSKILEMRSALYNWFNKYIDPEFDGVKEPVDGGGQCYWAGSRGINEQNYPGKRW
ncbi:MAG: sulfatase [Lentisphaerae bacterium GWF2_45_14]|nr:MAG: sulfatase [Lentisphaerae bacterium GWF2_45_14]